MIGSALQGRYRLERLLGRGGQGSVFLASDVRLGGKLCAVKQIMADRSLDAETHAKFRQQVAWEAALLGRFEHRSLAKVTDCFEEDGVPYLVMEYVDGIDLETLINQRGPAHPDQVIDWALQLLDALMALHEHPDGSVLHRDIKPGNVILTAAGRIVLVDFGLSRQEVPGAAGTQSILLGRGTPGYTPIEQYASSAGHTTPRSDIYSLGATLYFTLTGEAPPEAIERGAGIHELKPLKRFRSDLPVPLTAAVERALEQNPADRFVACKEMHSRLASSGAGYRPMMSLPDLRPTNEQPRLGIMPLFRAGILAGIVLEIAYISQELYRVGMLPDAFYILTLQWLASWMRGAVFASLAMLIAPLSLRQPYTRSSET